MIKPKSDNRTTRERPGSTAAKKVLTAEMARRRAGEKARGAALKPKGGGPRFSASTEPQPPHRRPVIR
jgi:hypothetical protein